jgi:predicted porin
MFKNTTLRRFLPCMAVALGGLAPVSGAQAGDDVKVLLEILMEKGIITQEEYEKKLKVAQEKEEIRAFNEAQDIRRANREIDKRAEDERKFKTQIYGQVSAGYYQASNMTSQNLDASGFSDQPKGNNRVGLRVSRELDADFTAVVTLESNFSARTGAVGREAGSSGDGKNPLFDREASVRLVSASYGTLLLGRGPNLQNDLSSAFDARGNWNFGGLKPLARYAGFHSAGINRVDRLVRYTSPSFNGFTADVSFAPGGVPGDAERGTNYYLGGRYKNGNFEMGYNHSEVRLGSSSSPTSQQEVNSRIDFLAAKYTLDRWTVNAGYVLTRNPSDPNAAFNRNAANGRVNSNTWFAGAVYRFTPQLSWNVGYFSVDDRTVQTNLNRNNDAQMVATGLTYSPYKEWDFFIDYAATRRQAGATGALTLYDRWQPDTGLTGSGNACSSSTANIGCSDSTRSQSGISVGALYRF